MAIFHTDHLSSLSLEILEALTKGLDFSVPNVEFKDIQIPDGLKDIINASPTKVDVKLLTSRHPRGEGVFDAVMEAISNHLREEYQANRITGAEYTKAYAGLTQAALQGAVQYALGKDSAYWGSITGQLSAIRALVELEEAKVRLAIAQAKALNNKAEYALTVAKLANEEAAYDVKEKQMSQIEAQTKLTEEQYETQRAYTLGTRSDGSPIEGKMEMDQKVQQEQINSYIKDAMQKTADSYIRAWTTNKSTDAGFFTPDELRNVQITEVLRKLRAETIPNAQTVTSTGSDTSTT